MKTVQFFFGVGLCKSFGCSWGLLHCRFFTQPSLGQASIVILVVSAAGEDCYCYLAAGYDCYCNCNCFQLLERIVNQIVIVIQLERIIIVIVIQLLEKMQTGRTVNCSPTSGKETLSQGALQLTDILDIII